MKKTLLFTAELAKCNTSVNLAIADGLPHINLDTGQITKYSKTKTIFKDTPNIEEKQKMIEAINNIKSVLNNKDYGLTSNEKTEILIEAANNDITKGLNAEIKYIPKK